MNNTTNPNSPDFKLSTCDGPDLSNLPTGKEVTIGGKTYTITHGANPDGYKPCNFNGLMSQAQQLINAAIILGVVVAIASFSYAGYLYITGVEANLKKARAIFKNVGLGFIIMLSAWFIVYQLLTWLTGNTAYTSLLGKP